MASADRPPSVAIVDDDRGLREQLGRALRQAGYHAIEAPSGLRLLSVLSVDRPDLILLDVAMRWIDGLELARSLKTNPSWRTIPIVIISGRTTDEDVAAGLAAGAERYLKKPLDVREVLDTVARVLQEHAHPLPASPSEASPGR